MELYNANTMPLSNNPKLREVQEKIMSGAPLGISDKMIAGRDYPIKKIGDYNLKPDHAYRAVSERMFEIYKETGIIGGTGVDDEYEEYQENGQTFNNNKGVDWYLGGAELKYGDIILECPADKDYFTPAYDNGSGMSFDPTIRFLKSSGAKKPIPLSMITRVFNTKGLKEAYAKVVLEEFKQIREIDNKRFSEIRRQQLNSFVQQVDDSSQLGGISR